MMNCLEFCPAFTTYNYLKDDGNDIIADVSLLGKMKAIIWVVRQQCRHVKHHLVMKNFHNSGPGEQCTGTP